MKKTLSIVLCAAFSLSIAAEVNYQVVALPQQIDIDASGNNFVLADGMTVSYPADDTQM